MIFKFCQYYNEVIVNILYTIVEMAITQKLYLCCSSSIFVTLTRVDDYKHLLAELFLGENIWHLNYWFFQDTRCNSQTHLSFQFVSNNDRRRVFIWHRRRIRPKSRSTWCITDVSIAEKVIKYIYLHDLIFVRSPPWIYLWLYLPSLVL